MRKLLIAIFLILSFCLGSMAQEKVYKIKPIKGKKSAVVQKQDLGYGMTKWSVTVERVGRTSEIYLPSDVLVFTEGQGYNPPNPSNSLQISSAKTADGFLFNANGPNNNNIQIHLKKSASSNSSYTLEVNLRQGEKYSFPIYYLPNNYLMVRGSSGDYENMISSISSNDYFKEALTYVDDELSKYQGESNLVWWALGFVGVFQDFVDVEAIGQVSSEAQYYTYSINSLSDDTYWFEWKCGSQFYEFPVEKNQFIVVTSANECLVALSSGGRYLLCAYSYCPPPDPNDPWNSEDQWKMCIAECQNDELPVIDDCENNCQKIYTIQAQACRSDCGGTGNACYDKCIDQAGGAYADCICACGGFCP